MYHINLKLKYHTKFGQSICVMGSIPELGEWKQAKCHLKWSEGHFWFTEIPIKTKNSFFMYKYVLYENGKI